MERDVWRTMVDAGVRTTRFRPPKPYALRRLNNRTHRKLLIADGRVGMTGGVGIAALVGLWAAGAVPFVVSPATTLAPAALLAVLGLAGAAVSLRPVVAADPTTALGALR